MRLWLTLSVLWLAGVHGGGVTNIDGEDFSEYWADDFKVSGHLYAKTSDKDLYGATLPPSVTYDVTATKSKGDSSEKTERFKYGDLSSASSTYPYNYDPQDHKEKAKGNKKETDEISNSESKSHEQSQPQDYKPLQYQQNDEFSYGNFKTSKYNHKKQAEKDKKVDISYSDNPYSQKQLQLYKPLEHQTKDEFPKYHSNFKPYFGIGANYDGINVHGDIKDVFNTPGGEKAIGTASEETREDNRVYATNRARSKVRLLVSNGIQSRTKCRAGICRKKAKNTNRVHSRPTKRIKKIVYNY